MPANRKIKAQEEYYQMRVEPLHKPYQFKVHGKTGIYEVDIRRQTCTCPDHKERQVKCKHIWRVELEGYKFSQESEAPCRASLNSKAANWKPDGDFAWFDSRTMPDSRPEYYVEHGIFLVAPGRKKQYKYWAAFPLYSSGQLILYWGDATEGELSLALSQKIQIGQYKVVKSHSPYGEAIERMEKKKAKDYSPPPPELKHTLEMAIVGQLFARGIVPGLTMQEENKEKFKKSRDWKSENISWF